MSDYQVRPATVADVDALVHHRLAMFHDMGVAVDAPHVEAAYRLWLLETMPTGLYRAWVVESGSRVISGAGITVVPWPPGPRYAGGRLAFVYNVYTEPHHRRQGLGRMLMEAIHAWCREERVSSLALNASRFGQSLYESLGYTVTTSPMMFLALD